MEPRVCPPLLPSRRVLIPCRDSLFMELEHLKATAMTLVLIPCRDYLFMELSRWIVEIFEQIVLIPCRDSLFMELPRLLATPRLCCFNPL